MELKHFSELVDTLATRSGHATVSWLGFSNTPLRRHLLEVFRRPYGASGSFLANPSFEAAFGWRTAETKLGELSGRLLHPSLVGSLDAPDPQMASDYRFPFDRRPYLHQIQSWQILSKPTRESVIVTSGTGSGKTECFLIPILNELIQEGSPTEPLIGVRALFLYPLNALINSQRDRLRAWTYGHNQHIRFCLYNGMTPEMLPAPQSRIKSEIRDRRTLRQSPPPILVTNATMLEYMLIRAQDAPILEASRGKLRWIILDEAHTYIGSQAAELALLIRRVLHAFGVAPQDVRFVATSATIGNANGQAGVHLREFLARVSGTSDDRVHLVSGERTVPVLSAQHSSDSVPIEVLREIDSENLASDKRYSALSSHKVARAVRNLFTSKSSALVARLSDVCEVTHGKGGPWSREDQNKALEWLDLLSGTTDDGGTPFLPLRGHLFHQTFAGLWCCANSLCTSKSGTALSDSQWPFGLLHLEPRKRCACGAPVFELIACQECGAIYLRAAAEGNRIIPPDPEAEEDDFALDLDIPVAAEAEFDANTVNGETNYLFSLSSEQSLVLIANRHITRSEVLHINVETGAISETAGPDTVSITAHESGPEGITCPECDKRGPTFSEVFRTGRVGAPFYLASVLPTLLEFAVDGDNPAMHTSRGRRLLTFTDSRQGTARLAARLQQDAERTKARGLIYHNLLAKRKEDPDLQAQIDALEAVPNPSIHIINVLNDYRERRRRSSIVGFRDLQRGIQQRTVDFEAIQRQYSKYSRDLFGGIYGPANVAETLILREMGRRPRRQNNLESMGLVSVCYPGLLGCVPPRLWTVHGRSDQDWQDFLKTSVDFAIRNGGCLEIRDEIWRWSGLPANRSSAAVSSNAEQLGKFQRRWPSAIRSGKNSLLVRLLERALAADIETTVGEDVVDAILMDAWAAVTRILTPTANGYVLPLDNLAFQTIREAWVCPFTRRFLDTALCGISPYTPRKMAKVELCQKVEIPIYELPFGGAPEGLDPVRQGRAWLDQESPVVQLREEGLWSIFNDRVVEFAMYYTAAEHSAQQPSAKLQDYENGFKSGDINILSCSTTMEMGIDIGGVQQVAMNNVPPHPANYLQRAGRAGRRSETRSTALTLCRPNPHDQNVFLHTRWAFDAALPAPVVSLNSAVIVQRHVNAAVLSSFLKRIYRQSSQELHKLTCGMFFLGTGSSQAKQLEDWCRSYSAGNDNDFDRGLQYLTKHTAFEGFPIESLVLRCAFALHKACDGWLGEWNALLEQESSMGSEEKDPAVKAIKFQKARLSNEYLLRELATDGFLPAYGFPSNVASFDSLTVSGLKNISQASMDSSGENNRYLRRELASRDVVTALREYAPGAEIVLDGLVYRSAGITLNWHIPASEADAREIQAIKVAWWCSHCGSSGASVVTAKNCEACGSELSRHERFLEPAGFSVDFYEDPHNDLTSQKFIPVERPWVSARGDWSPLANPILGRFRASTEGRVYHHSKGINGMDYAICLACGRAEPYKSNGDLPEVFSNPSGHYKLRSKAAERLCNGSTNPWAITRVALGHESRTDMIEIQLRDVLGKPLRDLCAARTVAVAVRDALAELLGVQATELGCDAREVRDETGHLQSIFVFDHFAAGYASTAARLMPELFHKAVQILSCPKQCDSCCPSCVLDFDQRFDATSLDRTAALTFLTPDWLKLLTIPEQLCFLGPSSQVEISPLFEAVLRESGLSDSGTTRLYLDGTNWDFAESPVRALAYKLLSMSRPVVLMIVKSCLASLTEIDGYSLASISEHPNASVRIIEASRTVGAATVIVEVDRGNTCLTWVSADATTVAPNESWGKSQQPIVFGTGTTGEPGKQCLPSSLRPLPLNIGDAELSIQSQLNGPIRGFGARFWSLVCSEHAATKKLMTSGEASVERISYSDRYLFTPLSIGLLHQVIASLKELVGQQRYGAPEIVINTTEKRQGTARIFTPKVFADWPNMKMRDEVALLVFQSLGKATFNLSSRLQHSRQLTVKFSTGDVLGMRFDQGVGYWRVSSWAEPGSKGPWFDFGNPNAKAQGERIRNLDVVLESQVAPTQVFITVRNSTGPKSETSASVSYA